MDCSHNSSQDEWNTNNNSWLLETDNPFASSHRNAFIGNGFIGQRIGIEGQAPYAKGDAEPANDSGCMIHGFWSDDSLMTPPLWASLDYYDLDIPFLYKNGTWKKYHQTLNMKTGILKTKCHWKIDKHTTKIESEIYLHRSHPNLGILSRSIETNFDGTVSFIDSLDGDFIGNGDNWHIRKDNKPDGIISVECCMGQQQKKIAMVSRLLLEGIDSPSIELSDTLRKISRKITFQVKSGARYKITKLVGIVTEAHAPVPWMNAFALVEGAIFHLNQLRQKHEAAWDILWKHRIEVSQPILQKLINASLYQIYSQLREDLEYGLGPTGLTGNVWGGRVFWDNDLWIFPGICLLNPKLAKGMISYRFKTLEGAKRNAECEGYDGAMFAWQSAEFGDECIPQKIFHHQHHINSDIALTQWWYYLISNDRKYLEEKAALVIIESAKFWASYADFNPQKNCYEIKHVCCADELAGIRDNNAFTNYGVVKNLKLAQTVSNMIGRETPTRWLDIADKMWIPFDENNLRYLEYENYNGNIIKQADTTLLIYPYELPMEKKAKQNTVKYYKSRYQQDSIMMGAAIDGIIDCELGNAESGWTALKQLMRHFRGPFLLASERPSNECISFLTGLGGLLQLVLMGFAGIRFRNEELQVQPCLPKELDSILIRGMTYKGCCFDLMITTNSVKVMNSNSNPDFTITNATGIRW